MIEFPCQTCNSVLRTPDGTEGKQSRCPSCGMIQTIPGGTQPGGASQPSGNSNLGPLPQSHADPVQVPNPGAPPQANPFPAQPPHTPYQQPVSPYQQPASHPDQPSPNPYSQNPYQTPAGYQPASKQPYYDYRAAEKIKGPAIGMLVVHILMALFFSLAIMGGLMSLAEGNKPPEEDYVMLAFCGVTLAMAIFGIVGSVFMLRQKLWGLSMATSIVTILSGISCCFVPTAFGIWGIVMLLDPGVKDSFQ